MNNTWRTFSDPTFGLSFKYPLTTPHGHKVALDEYKLHFRSLGSGELYFEITRYLAASAQAVYAREKAFVGERYGASVGELSETTFKGHPALYSFTWQEEAKKERHVISIPRDENLYRIYDPNAPLNDPALASLELS